jgi:hypothetical protein
MEPSAVPRHLLPGPLAAAVKGGGERAGALDDVAGGERGSVRHRAAGPAPVGGSNRVVSVDELAAYLGVPKKTVYGCWRQWAFGGTGSAGTCGSASGTWRNGSGIRRHELMASIIKRCGCGDWDDCPHPWVVRYRTEGGRTSKQREQSFGDDLKEAEDFLLKVEHDKKAHVFIDPKAGKATFRSEAEA